MKEVLLQEDMDCILITDASFHLALNGGPNIDKHIEYLVADNHVESSRRSHFVASQDAPKSHIFSLRPGHQLETSGRYHLMGLRPIYPEPFSLLFGIKEEVTERKME